MAIGIPFAVGICTKHETNNIVWLVLSQENQNFLVWYSKYQGKTTDFPLRLLRFPFDFALVFLCEIRNFDFSVNGRSQRTNSIVCFVQIPTANGIPMAMINLLEQHFFCEKQFRPQDYLRNRLCQVQISKISVLSLHRFYRNPFGFSAFLRCTELKVTVYSRD